MNLWPRVPDPLSAWGVGKKTLDQGDTYWITFTISMGAERDSVV
jgi:hypothetical protein